MMRDRGKVATTADLIIGGSVPKYRHGIALVSILLTTAMIGRIKVFKS
jgi:hypothetical protein